MSTQKKRPISDGVVHKLSFSLIDSFDNSSVFGCERRGWFKYVQGIKEPSSRSMLLGNYIHKQVEEFLTGGSIADYSEGLTEEELKTAATLLELAKPEITKLAKDAVGVELDISHSILGIPLIGKCDLVLKDGIADWKTTSNIRKYGATTESLKNNSQLLVYTSALYPQLERVKLYHGLFQTKLEPSFRLVESYTSGKASLDFVNTVLTEKVKRIKEVATFKTEEQTTVNKRGCFLCPHKAYCKKGEIDVMSFFSKMTSPSNQSNQSNQETTPEAPQAAAPILPPDAPTPTVQKPTETPPIAKKRGRPLGASQKQPPAIPSTAQLEITECTISYGATINLGNFNSIRFDVSATAKSDGDYESTYGKLLKDVQSKVDAEVEKIKTQAQPAK